jgi:hypothetical protein
MCRPAWQRGFAYPNQLAAARDRDDRLERIRRALGALEGTPEQFDGINPHVIDS